MKTLLTDISHLTFYIIACPELVEGLIYPDASGLGHFSNIRCFLSLCIQITERWFCSLFSHELPIYHIALFNQVMRSRHIAVVACINDYRILGQTSKKLRV